jgi:hypothetical protein
MAIKTRLTSNLRMHLHALVRREVKEAPEREAGYLAAYREAEKHVRRLAKVQYPAKDMAVLAKYGINLHPVRSVALAVGDFRVDYLHLRHKDGSKIDTRDPQCLMLPDWGSRVKLDAAGEKAFDDFVSLAAAREKELKDTQDALYLLIGNVRTLEQVEEVWPKAKLCRQYVRTMPVVVLTPAIETIQQAIAEKRA